MFEEKSVFADSKNSKEFSDFSKIIKDGIFADSKNRKFLDSPIKEKQLIGDLHIHSRFSRACSKAIDFDNLVKYAKIKGVDLLGTGDFTHPTWFSEIIKLREEKGILYYQDFPFVISGEISLMYTQDGKGRRVHLVLLMPSIEVAKQFNKWIIQKGRVDYDGRPIFGFSCVELMDAVKSISSDIEVIPAHIWTPWFGLFGSNSGFNSIKQAFQDKEKNIHSIETGMSSDPEMNWKISELNNKTILSFSDMHSFWPWRIGREATIFSRIERYRDLIKQIRENKILGTVETEPAYGKYHYDGHRACDFSCSPDKTKELLGKCPKCGKNLIIGVENRVEELTTQEIDENKNQKPYYKLLPLHEIISLTTGTSLATKKNWEIYNPLIGKFGNEFNIVLKISKKDLLKSLPKNEKLVELILKNRKGKIKVKPGYDGEYGVAVLGEKQGRLF